jgi:hypothetical protein
MGYAHGTRDLRHASSDELTAMRDAATVLINHERRINPGLLTGLWQIREETTTALVGRTLAVNADSRAT